MHIHIHGRQTIIIILLLLLCQKSARQPNLEAISFTTHVYIGEESYSSVAITFFYWQVFFRQVKETNKATTLSAHFFYK